MSKCQYCGDPTTVETAKLCDPCWNASHWVKVRPGTALRTLGDMFPYTPRMGLGWSSLLGVMRARIGYLEGALERMSQGRLFAGGTLKLSVDDYQLQAKRLLHNSAQQDISRLQYLEAALEVVVQKRGAYDPDPLQHAHNCVNDMASVASAALAGTWEIKRGPDV